MANTSSIRENIAPARLPDFCNLGVWLRVLLAVNALAGLAALARNSVLGEWPREFVELAALVEPAAITTLLLLCAGHRLSSFRLAFWPHAMAVVASAVVATTLFVAL